MPPDHPNDGFSGNIHDDGRVEILLWSEGKCIQSLHADQKALGSMAAGFLKMAHESAQRAGVKPTAQPGSRPDSPPIPISASGLIANKKNNTFALGFSVGAAQIAFQIPQSMLGLLGRQLLAASAQGRAH